VITVKNSYIVLLLTLISYFNPSYANGSISRLCYNYDLYNLIHECRWRYSGPLIQACPLAQTLQ